MTERRQLRRIELALASYGLAVMLVVLATGVDAIRFHLVAALESGIPGSIGDAAVIVLAALDLAIVGLALWSVCLQVLRSSRCLARLEVLGVRRSRGCEFVLVGGVAPQAFCAGLLRPRVYVSDAALRRLSEEELFAVVAHERHHARRRDPLRLLLARAVTRATPGLGRLADRHSTVAELAADAAAIELAGAPRHLASALVSLGEQGGPDLRGIAPERVDHLMGALPRRGVPDWALIPIAVSPALLGLAVVAGALPGGWDLCATLLGAPAPLLAGCACVAGVIVPTWLVARSAAAAVRPCD